MQTIVDFVAFDLSVHSLLNETAPVEVVAIPEENSLPNVAGIPSILSGGIIKDGFVDVSLMLPDGSVSTAKMDISRSETHALELAQKGWIVIRVSTNVKSWDE